MSRYENNSNSSSSNKYKRCIECGNTGHFKCSGEQRSKLIKLTFKVEDNLDEFFVAGIDKDNVINYEVPADLKPSPKSKH